MHFDLHGGPSKMVRLQSAYRSFLQQGPPPLPEPWKGSPVTPVVIASGAGGQPRPEQQLHQRQPATLLLSFQSSALVTLRILNAA